MSLQMLPNLGSSLQLKICCTCKIPHPVSNFVASKSRVDKRHPRCKDCTRKCYMSNRDNNVRKACEYRQAHRDQIRANGKIYSAKRFFFTRANLLAFKHKGEESASTFELASLWRKQRGKCALSGRRLNRGNCHIDHIIPAIKCGPGSISNIRWLHKDVNYAKRDLDDSEFLKLCKEIVEAIP